MIRRGADALNDDVGEEITCDGEVVTDAGRVSVEQGSGLRRWRRGRRTTTTGRSATTTGCVAEAARINTDLPAAEGAIRATGRSGKHDAETYEKQGARLACGYAFVYALRNLPLGRPIVPPAIRYAKPHGGACRWAVSACDSGAT